jgi:hypothetical protein
MDSIYNGNKEDNKCLLNKETLKIFKNLGKIILNQV